MKTKLFLSSILLISISLCGCGKSDPMASNQTDLSLEATPAAAKQIQGTDKKKTKLLDRIGLTEDQQAKFKDLRKAQSEQIKAVREAYKNGALDKDGAKATAARIKAEYETGLGAILSAEQLEAYKNAQARLARQKARLQQQRKKAPPSPFRGLNLTDEQKARIKDLNKTKSEQSKAIREAYKNGALDKDGAKAEAARIKSEYETGLGVILSAEQLEAYKNAQARLARQKAKNKRKKSDKQEAPSSGSGDAQG